MADSPANGNASAAAPATTAAPSAAPSAEAKAAKAADERSAFLSDLAASKGEQKPAVASGSAPAAEGAAAPSAAGAGSDTAAAPDADLDEDDTAAPTDPDADLDEDDAGGDDAAKLAATDPDLAKRLAVIQRQEQRQRAAFDKERQAFEAEKAQWAQQAKDVAASAKRFDNIAARFEVDPLGVLEELKVPPAAWEAISRSIFAQTEPGKQDPKNAAYAAQLRAKQAERNELAELKAEQARLKSEIETARVTAQRDVVLNDYFGRVNKAVGEKHPLTAKMLATNPTKARADMEIVAMQLAQETGSLPSERAVVIAYEKQRRQVLRDLGIDPKAAIKPPEPAKPAAKAAKPAAAKPAEKPEAPAVVETQAPPPVAADNPRDSFSRARDPYRDEILAEMAKRRTAPANN